MKLRACYPRAGYSWAFPTVFFLIVAGLLASPAYAFLEADLPPEPGELQLNVGFFAIDEDGNFIPFAMNLFGNQVEVESFEIENPSGLLFPDPDGLDPFFTLTENTSTRIAGYADPPVILGEFEGLNMGFGMVEFDALPPGIPDLTFWYQPAGGDLIEGKIGILIPEPTFALPLALGALIIRRRRWGTQSA